MREHGKITGSHLGWVALVYVRQSTLVQVRDHTESTARQYGLVEEGSPGVGSDENCTN